MQTFTAYDVKYLRPITYSCLTKYFTHSNAQASTCNRPAFREGGGPRRRRLAALARSLLAGTRGRLRVHASDESTEARLQARARVT